MTDEPNPEFEKLCKQFCEVVMPGHDKKKGYINVSKKVSDLGIDRRTYYHWKNGQSLPSTKVMIDLLNKRGYTMEIVPLKDFYNA